LRRRGGAAAPARPRGREPRTLRRLGADDLTEADVAALQRVIVDTGARDEIEATIARLVDEALGALAAAPITPEARCALEELGTYVAWRDR
jgi:geranylgeranyl diphosphate synthase type I